MQRTPAVYCVRLARALVDDYCSLGPGSIQTLQHVFSTSPRFCCQFITAIVMLYDLSSGTFLSAGGTMEAACPRPAILYAPHDSQPDVMRVPGWDVVMCVYKGPQIPGQSQG